MDWKLVVFCGTFCIWMVAGASLNGTIGDSSESVGFQPYWKDGAKICEQGWCCPIRMQCCADYKCCTWVIDERYIHRPVDCPDAEGTN